MLYISHIRDPTLWGIFSSGLCVKTCPSATEVKDSAWWAANCKDNSAIDCSEVPADPLRQYTSEDGARICYPTISDDESDDILDSNMEAVANEMKNSQSG